MKTQEELNALKEEVVTLNEKLKELTEEELKQVTGGYDIVLSGGTSTFKGLPEELERVEDNVR